MLGATASGTLLGNATNRWQVIEQDNRLRMVRITGIHPGQPAVLESVRNQVIRDWKQFRNDIQLADQTKSLADRYRIELALSPHLSARLNTAQTTPLDAVSSRVN